MNIAASYQPQWVREDFVDFVLEKVNPIWSWKKVKAQVIDVQPLSDDFFQIKLLPNAHFDFKNVQAGQSVLVTVVIDGVRQQRSYSIIKIDEKSGIYLGVKVQGMVSSQMSRLQAGDIIEISQAQGDFILSKEIEKTQPLLLIASGSGITAIYALLDSAIAQGYQHIHVLYFSRDQALVDDIHQLIAAQKAKSEHHQIHFYHINTKEKSQHFTTELLTELNIDFKQMKTYVCGAHNMMQAVQEMYRQHDLTEQLHMEYFQSVIDESLAAQPIRFLRAQQEFQADRNLLESAEQAGLRPAHGCRMGICNTCTCTKVSGSTKNILTGEIDHSNNTQIKLCISQAVSPVVINL